MMHYISNYQYTSLKQSQKPTLRTNSIYAWLKHNSKISSLCGCFSTPTDFKPLPTALPLTLTMLDTDPVDIDHAKAANSSTETEINQQFASSESDLKQYYHCNKKQMLIMHRSRRSFEMVLQEVCVQHCSVETMRNIHQTELSKTSMDNIADHCSNYYNNNNNNDEDFLPTGKTIIHDDSIRSSTLMEIPEIFQKQNIQRTFS